ncbi:MAG: sulfite exporter TauE/SafE family protein [Afipia sp.]|nr:sulfite exporter TauE/SafE family protein [Afipia sp.]
MTLFQIVVLAVAGFAAGTMNAIAGGGTFVTFAALVVSGLPTLDANATSAVALTPANLASVAAYRSEVRAHFREMIPFAIIGLIGGGVGALLLIWLGDGGFRPLVPWLLLVATLMFAFSRQIRLFVARWSQGQHTVATVVAYAVMMIVAIYGGFFGAGIGIMMLAALSIIASGDFHKANSTKILVAFLIQVVSAALLIAGGLVHWPQALVTIVASSLGGYYGVGFARIVPEKIIRAAVVAVGAGLTIVFFLRA